MSSKRGKTKNDSSPFRGKSDQDSEADYSESESSITSVGYGLPQNVEKQLAADIKAAGGIGIGRSSYVRIYNRRLDLYGEIGSDRRRQVRNKVQRWREQSRDRSTEKRSEKDRSSMSSNHCTPKKDVEEVFASVVASVVVDGE